MRQRLNILLICFCLAGAIASFAGFILEWPGKTAPSTSTVNLNSPIFWLGMNLGLWDLRQIPIANDVPMPNPAWLGFMIGFLLCSRFWFRRFRSQDYEEKG